MEDGVNAPPESPAMHALPHAACFKKGDAEAFNVTADLAVGHDKQVGGGVVGGEIAAGTAPTNKTDSLKPRDPTNWRRSSASLGGAAVESPTIRYFVVGCRREFGHREDDLSCPLRFEVGRR